MLIFITSITIGIVIINNKHSFKVNEYSNKTNSKLNICNFLSYNRRIKKSSRQLKHVCEVDYNGLLLKIFFYVVGIFCLYRMRRQ